MMNTCTATRRMAYRRPVSSKAQRSDRFAYPRSQGENTFVIQWNQDVERISADSITHGPPPESAPPPEDLAPTVNEINKKIEGATYAFYRLLNIA